MKKLIFTFAFILFFSNIFAQWSEQSSGVTTALRSASSTSASNVGWICGASGVVLKTTNTGTNWINVSTGIPSSYTLISISAVDANLALVAGYSGSNTYLYRTSNGGANWMQVLTEAGFYDAVCMVNSTTGFLAGDPVGGRWSLWKTTNGGANWDSTGLYLPIIHSAEAGWNNSMFISYPKIWVGTNDTVLLYSSNFGVNWTRFKTTGEPNGYSVCMNWAGNGAGFVAGSIAMFQTENNGANWTTVTTTGSGSINGIAYTDMLTDLIHCPVWYIRSGTSIYVCLTGGSFSTEYVASVGTYNGISVAKPGRGIWAVRSNGGISFHTIISDIHKITSQVPDKVELSQNYPNPFNPKTKIRYQLTTDNLVTLKIFNALGKEVSTLVNQKQYPGAYEVSFDGGGLSSGIYFYRLEAGKFSDVKRMILVK